MRLTKITLFIFLIFNVLSALLSSCQEDTIDRKDNLAASAQNLTDQSSSESETDVNVIPNMTSESSESSETLGLGLAPTLSLTGTVTPTGASVKGYTNSLNKYISVDGILQNLASTSTATSTDFIVTVDGTDLALNIATYLSATFQTTMGSTTVKTTHGDYFNRYPHNYPNWIGPSSSTGVGTSTTLTANNPCQELQGISTSQRTWDFLYENPPPTNNVWPGGSYMDGTMRQWQNGTLIPSIFSCQYNYSKLQTSGNETGLFSMFVQNTVRLLCGSGPTIYNGATIGINACANSVSLNLAPLYRGHRNRIWFSWPAVARSCNWTTYLDGDGNSQNVLQGSTCKLPVEYLGYGTDANKRATNLYNALPQILNLINARTVEYSGTRPYQFFTSNYYMPMSTLIGQYTGSDFPRKLFVFNPSANGTPAIPLLSDMKGNGLLFKHEHLFEQYNSDMTQLMGFNPNLTQPMAYFGTGLQVKTLFQKQTLKDLAGAAPCFFYNGGCGYITALMPPSSYLVDASNPTKQVPFAPNLFMILWDPPSNPGTQATWLEISSASNAYPDGYSVSKSQAFNYTNTGLFYRIYRDSNGYYIFTDPSGQTCLYASQSTNPNANRFLLTEPCNPTNKAERFH